MEGGEGDHRSISPNTAGLKVGRGGVTSDGHFTLLI